MCRVGQMAQYNLHDVASCFEWQFRKMRRKQAKKKKRGKNKIEKTIIVYLS